MVRNRGLLTLLVFMGIFVCSLAGAEVKVFEQEVEEAVSRGQSQEQVEAFALQKAKRLAVEEAGTYISSLTVVRNYQLQSDEVTALASGVVQAKIVEGTSVRVENGVVHVKVKARISVDTSILDRQIQDIMKEKGTLKKLETEQRKVRELEEKLASLKSSEVKRLEELNMQALALERERDQQRLFREEQALKARGELSRAEADRFAKEREMQDKINRTLAEQERAKRDEEAALKAEQDSIKRAQLENEQRWNDLARKAKISQESWVAIDDSLSLKQALTEVNDLKREIAPEGPPRLPVRGEYKKPDRRLYPATRLDDGKTAA
ncbi:MAG: GRAM domain containing protein [Syntrophaceae bacterium]|nr:MAG: GRAM domain containing protein [Syntrophaceae bacterium]